MKIYYNRIKLNILYSKCDFDSFFNEKSYNSKNQCIIEINKKYFRPADVDSLVGSYKKAKKILKWKPKITLNEGLKLTINSIK